MTTASAAGTHTAAARAIDGPLLAFLARELATPELRFDEPPQRMLGGFDTTIYGFSLDGAPDVFSRPLIIRVFGSAADAERAAFEMAAQNALASMSFPAPRVLLFNREPSEIGGPFTIMPRVPGRVMLDVLLGPKVFAMVRALGETQARLHDLDAGEFRRQLDALGVKSRLVTTPEFLRQWSERIGAAKLDGLQAAMRWLESNMPSAPARESVCHGDFHPLNLLVEGDTVSGVVDWAGVEIADPAYDVGASYALFTQGPVDLPGFLQPMVQRLRSWLAGRYLRAYTAQRPLDMAAMRYFEALRLLGFVLEAGEEQRSEGTDTPLRANGPFRSPRIQRNIGRRFRQLTGVEVSLPA